MQRKYTALPFTEYVTATGHYDTNRAPITEIVLHSSASTRQGLIDTFGGGTRMVSAHYGIDNDGSILAFLEEYNTAYHAGNYAVNEKSIGIEHIDNGSTVKLHTDAQYATSIKLVADICKFYSIPCDSLHVVPHSSIVATACPNGLDVNRIIEGAKALLNPPPPPQPELVITDQTKIPQLENKEVQQIKSELIAKDLAIAAQDGQIADLKSTVASLNAQLTELQYKLDHLPTPTPNTLLTAIRDVIWGSGWVWVRMNKLKLLLPR